MKSGLKIARTTLNIFKNVVNSMFPWCESCWRRGKWKNKFITFHFLRRASDRRRGKVKCYVSLFTFRDVQGQTRRERWKCFIFVLTFRDVLRRASRNIWKEIKYSAFRDMLETDVVESLERNETFRHFATCTRNSSRKGKTTN